MSNQWSVPALRGVLGDWVYYSALLTADDIARQIKPSHEIREAKALEDYLQRALKPRVQKIATYLFRRDSRFFNSVIIGIFDGLPRWAEFELKPGNGNRKVVESPELKESIGLLIFDGKEKMFAVDGQHRVEGIKAAYKKEAERLEHDQFPVIFIAHLDTTDGKVRTRRLFCDINKNAVAVSGGDKVIIDEDDLSAIATRRLYAEYPPFKRGKLIALTERKEMIEQDGEGRFTSLLAIYTTAKKLKRLFQKKRGTLESDPENVVAFQKIVARFFDFIMEHEPSLRKFFKEGTTSLESERRNNKNLFFRPVGLEVLARLYVHFQSRDALKDLAHGLKQIKFNNPGGIFDGILWSAGKISAGSKERTAATDLCLYLLGQLDEEHANDLIGRLRQITNKTDYQLPLRLNSAKH